MEHDEDSEALRQEVIQVEEDELPRIKNWNRLHDEFNKIRRPDPQGDDQQKGNANQSYFCCCKSTLYWICCLQPRGGIRAKVANDGELLKHGMNFFDELDCNLKKQLDVNLLLVVFGIPPPLKSFRRFRCCRKPESSQRVHNSDQIPETSVERSHEILRQNVELQGVMSDLLCKHVGRSTMKKVHEGITRIAEHQNALKEFKDAWQKYCEDGVVFKYNEIIITRDDFKNHLNETFR
mmetsp:Transcript_1236/g.1660  ORF Transcript_1236/g.1660 Transcript_1236/m.1660 type:complete len:236 (-) Transcript_1236:65-772(-)